MGSNLKIKIRGCPQGFRGAGQSVIPFDRQEASPCLFWESAPDLSVRSLASNSSYGVVGQLHLRCFSFPSSSLGMQWLAKLQLWIVAAELPA